MSGHASIIKAPAILSDVRELIASPMQERVASTSAIKECVSAVEAFMNELAELGVGYERSGHSPSGPGPENRIALLGQRLKAAESQRKSVKAKIEVAYEVLTSKRLAKGNLAIYQKFSLVADIRNELAHPKASIEMGSDYSISPQKNELRLIRRLRSHGFSKADVTDRNAYNWMEVVSSRRFALWAYQVVIDLMVFIFQLWPFKNAVDGFNELYGLKFRNFDSWAREK